MSTPENEFTIPDNKTKIDVFAALYNQTKPIGLGILHPNANGPIITSRVVALQKFYAQCPRNHCDYVDGRAIKFYTTPKVNFKGYNEIFGAKAAEKAIATNKPLEPLPTQYSSLEEQASKDPCVLFSLDLFQMDSASNKQQPELLHMFEKCKQIRVNQMRTEALAKKLKAESSKITKCTANYAFLQKPIGFIGHQQIDCREALKHIQSVAENATPNDVSIGNFLIQYNTGRFSFGKKVDLKKELFVGEDITTQQATDLLSAVVRPDNKPRVGLGMQYNIKS